jgi:predicted DNA-binding mobile mystery protein A
MPKKRQRPIGPDFKRLQLKQMEDRLDLWKRVRDQMAPPHGWVSAIRETLGMGVGQLANRLDVTPAAVVQLERREVESKVTLESLRKAAEAMDCELVYAIVPKTSLWDTLQNQAQAVAHERVQRVGHTMHLEGQRASEDEEARQEAALKQELLAQMPRGLWSPYRRRDPDARGAN